MIKIIKAFFSKRAEKKAKQEAKIENIINGYEALIEEYELIMSKKSKLSSKKRKEVILRVAHLVAKGHIVVNQKKE